METYEVYYKDVFLGVLQVEPLTGRHAYTPDAGGVQKVNAVAALPRAMAEGTGGFGAPIPFLQNRLMQMRRSGLDEIQYQTDYFLVKRRRENNG